jgi:signal transduction histidine kinase
MAESAGVAASVQAELKGLAPPSNKIRIHLLRIAQEATTQALRHAEPRCIVVRLKRGDGGVVFELEDDGNANEALREKRSLATLRGRVAALGGTTEVRRGDGGWVTRVRLPCEQLN